MTLSSVEKAFFEALSEQNVSSHHCYCPTRWNCKWFDIQFNSKVVFKMVSFKEIFYPAEELFMEDCHTNWATAATLRDTLKYQVIVVLPFKALLLGGSVSFPNTLWNVARRSLGVKHKPCGWLKTPSTKLALSAPGCGTTVNNNFLIL